QLLYKVAAEIHPGNSGGPCFNARGEVVGVVTAKVEGSDKAIALCVPVGKVQDALGDVADPAARAASAEKAAGWHCLELVDGRLSVAGNLAARALAPSDDASTDARTDAAWPIAHAALVRDLEPARQVVWGNEALPEDLRWAAVNLATNYMHMK